MEGTLRCSRGTLGCTKGVVEYSRGSLGVPQRGTRGVPGGGRGVPGGGHGVRWVLTGTLGVLRRYLVKNARARACARVSVCAWVRVVARGCVRACVARGLFVRACARVCVRACVCGRVRVAASMVVRVWFLCVCVVACLRARVRVCARDFVWGSRSIGKHLRACVFVCMCVCVHSYLEQLCVRASRLFGRCGCTACDRRY
jgi:hypothetical protein